MDVKFIGKIMQIDIEDLGLQQKLWENYVHRYAL